ncbi:MAG: aminoacyl-tRNA hydrolase [Patescibacteria group bacterium]
MKKILIVGLGNPSKAYRATRHNLGFLAVDKLADQAGEKFSLAKKHNAQLANIQQNNQQWLLAKPQTFMNNSGSAVRSLVQYYKIDLNNLWIISDDVDLSFGKIRVRQQGSAGGHQGLQSIINELGTNEFNRLRIGLGSNRPLKIPAEDYVLQKFTLTEQQQLPEIIDQALTTLADNIK